MNVSGKIKPAAFRISGLVVLLAVFSYTSLFAHNTPSSLVMLDFYRDHVDAELTLPLAELELSFKQPLVTNPAEAFAKNHSALRDYLQAHVDPQAEDGRAWSVGVQTLALQTNQQPFDLIARVTMTPPPGATTRKFNFNYSVINHEVMSHYAIVSVRNDWNTATFSHKPELLGDIHFNVTALSIDRSKGSWWYGFHSILLLGIHHIAQGTDHLLFLLVLLLPAPVLAAGKRWGKFAGWKTTLFRLVKIVSAFTFGHSLTLLIGATGLIQAPSRPVEILIAISILVSAIHAIRPWFAGKETYIAAGFGLIHGLAFADSIAGFGFSPWYLACTVFGFNAGIELMQLLVVAAIVPWLILLSRTKFYAWVRSAGAAFAAIAAIAWIAQRAWNFNNPLDSTISSLAVHPFWLVAALAIPAVLLTLAQRIRQTRQPGQPRLNVPIDLRPIR